MANGDDTALLRFSRDHIPALDGFRGVAVILVLWGHLGPQNVIPSLPSGMAGFGVIMFFVLSGFLITRILLHNKANGVPWRHFYIRRAKRIFPAFYLMLAVYTLYFGWSDSVWYAGTYTYNLFPQGSHDTISHVWSLCVEEHFYLAWPVAALFLPIAVSKRLAFWGIVASIVGVFALEVWLIRSQQGMSVSRTYSAWTPFRMAPILLGSLFAYYEGNFVGIKRGFYAGLIMLLGAMVGTDAIQLFASEFGLGGRLAAHQLWAALFAGGLFLIVLSGQSGSINAVLENDRLRFVGKISYGLYLYHTCFYAAIGAQSSPGIGLGTVKLVSALGLTFAVAYLSYTYFERPILDGRWPWKRRLFVKSESHSHASSTTTVSA